MSKRKQYNPRKKIDFQAKQELEYSAIGCIPTKGPCHLFNLRTGKTVPILPKQINLISTMRHQWSVFIAVFGIDQFGKYYMKSNEISVNKPTYQVDMITTLNDAHSNLIKEFNPEHLISVGWLATPYLKIWNESKAFTLLESLGALNFVTKNTNDIASNNDNKTLALSA